MENIKQDASIKAWTKLMTLKHIFTIAIPRFIYSRRWKIDNKRL